MVKNNVKYDWDIARKNMRKIRQKHNMTQLSLSLDLGWSQNAISRIENGSGYPSINFVMCWCEFFKIHIEDLFKKDLIED